MGIYLCLIGATHHSNSGWIHSAHAGTQDREEHHGLARFSIFQVPSRRLHKPVHAIPDSQLDIQVSDYQSE